SQEEIHETASALYRAGILAREGDLEELPVGTMPRVFVTRELTLGFRRVQDEIDTGDLSTTPLRALLELLDDPELEASAALWGLHVIPGLRQRDELILRILEQVGDATRVAAVSARQRRDAVAIWRRMGQEENGAPVALADAAAVAGLGDTPHDAQRLATALAELETSLLVWHTYGPGGARYLFVPAELRAPHPPAPRDLPPLTPVATATIAPLTALPLDALAWDLLTLLREISRTDTATPRYTAGEPFPRAWARRINPRLWQRGSDTPPPGYLSFLIQLGLAEGLLQAREQHGPTHLDLGGGIRAWRDRSFSEQTSRLRWWWQASRDWIEAAERDTVRVEGADWRAMRRRLVALLAEIDPQLWQPRDALTDWIAARDPDLLGPTFQAATARNPRDERDQRRHAIAEVVDLELETAARWFGLVEIAPIPGQTEAVRVTEACHTYAASAVLGGAPVVPPPVPTAEGPALTIAPDGMIQLNQPTPLRVWSLSAFADLEALDAAASYRLTAASLGRALAAGFDLAQITNFLSGQSGTPLPPSLTETLAGWVQEYGRVWLHPAILVTPESDAIRDDLQRAATEAGFTPRILPDGSLLVLPPANASGGELSQNETHSALIAAWRAAGFSPQWVTTSEPGDLAALSEPAS
ncbi:MAG: helicase-associated domain-containing protein, partial [Chloroflexota bacterium]|nr:helicase-associated domain-containing protein [Chloroflexota bacterium]